MEQIVTDFFERIYEATKAEMPSFLVKAHEFDVTRAVRNPTDPVSVVVLAKEDAYAAKMDLLRESYGKVLGVLGALPESLQVAGLHVLAGQVGETIAAMGLSESVMLAVNEELGNTLSALPAPTMEQLQQAGGIIQQIVAASEASAG